MWRKYFACKKKAERWTRLCTGALVYTQLPLVATLVKCSHKIPWISLFKTTIHWTKMSKSGTQAENMCYNSYSYLPTGWNPTDFVLDFSKILFNTVYTVRLYTFKCLHSTKSIFMSTAHIYLHIYFEFAPVSHNVNPIYLNITNTIFTFYNDLFVLRTSCSALCMYIST